MNRAVRLLSIVTLALAACSPAQWLAAGTIAVQTLACLPPPPLVTHDPPTREEARALLGWTSTVQRCLVDQALAAGETP